MYGCIYVIWNDMNRKLYVGQTTWDPFKRFSHGHCNGTRLRVKNLPLSNAIRKYGRQHFRVAVLEECDDQSSMDAAEIAWTEVLHALEPEGYSVRAGMGKGVMSDLHRERLIEAKRLHPTSPEGVEAIRRWHLGRKMTLETKEKISRSLLGNARTQTKSGFLLHDTEGLVSISNVKKFCQTRGLDRTKMYALIMGRTKQYEGYRLPDNGGEWTVIRHHFGGASA